MMQASAKKNTAEMNDFHDFPLAESAKLDAHGAQIDTPGISIFESRVAACVRAENRDR